MEIPFQGALSFFLGLFVLMPGYLVRFIVFVLALWLIGMVLHALFNL